MNNVGVSFRIRIDANGAGRFVPATADIKNLFVRHFLLRA